MNRTRKIVTKVLVVLVLVAGAPIVGILLARSRQAAAANALPPSASASRVETPAAAPVSNDFVAVLLPPQMANLSPKADGRIVAVRVKVGQAVHAGDTLVEFDPQERQHDLDMARAALDAARAEAGGSGASYRAARRRLSMLRGTVVVGGKSYDLTSAIDVTKAEADMATAGASSAAAASKIKEQRAKVAQLELALRETELRAPYDGVVTAINFEPGATAHTGDSVVRVVGNGTGGPQLRVRIAVPEQSGLLARRRRARLTLDGVRTMVADIDQRAIEVEPASRTYFVEGQVEVDHDSCGGDCAMLDGREVRATMLADGRDTP
ncbi:MAG TPA: biotin/lipoyl-binding protein [Polyangiaceae bacterium]